MEHLFRERGAPHLGQLNNPDELAHRILHGRPPPSGFALGA
jgi:hypothetical protein